MAAKRVKRAPSRATQLASMKDVHVVCRAIGHSYAFESGYGVADKQGVTHVNWGWIKLVCNRMIDGQTCDMESERTSDPFSKLIGRTYKRPKGYDIVGAGRGDWRREARVELFNRFAGPRPRGRTRRAKKG